jgi:hypothetical protein
MILFGQSMSVAWDGVGRLDGAAAALLGPRAPQRPVTTGSNAAGSADANDGANEMQRNRPESSRLLGRSETSHQP